MAQSMKALAEGHADGIKKQTQFQVDPRKLRREQGFNLRGMMGMTPALRAHIDAFKLTWRNGGSIPPLAVRVQDDEILVVDGHTRLTAAMELIDEGFEIPFVSVFEHKGNDADRVAYMLTSAQGLALTPLEVGHGYLRLVRFGWPLQQIADRNGTSVAHVEQLLLLANANMDVQQMVAREEVAAHLAVELLRKHGDRTGEVLQQMLNKATDSGKKKVTKSLVYGPTIPRDVVGRVVSSLGSFHTAIQEQIGRLPNRERETLQDLLAKDDADLSGKSVVISAETLKQILVAHQEVQQVFEKAAARDEKRKADVNKKGKDKAAA